MKNENAKGHKVVAGLMAGFVVTALLVLVLTFGGVNSMVTDGTIQSVQTVAETIKQVTHEVVEKIDGTLVSVGTRNEIAMVSASILADAEAQAVDEVNNYYDSMITGVDPFLDWYFSLGGQYGQLWNMVKGFFSGDIDLAMTHYLTDKMTAYLNPGVDLTSKLGTIANWASTQIASAAASIVEKNAIEVQDDGSVVYEVSFEGSVESIVLSVSDTFVTASSSAMVKAAAGVAAGIGSKTLVKKIVTKVLAKGTGKMAVQTLGKLALKAVPGLGLVIGIGVDLIGNELDEMINRASFSDEIVASINADREVKLLEVHHDFDTYSQSKVL